MSAKKEQASDREGGRISDKTQLYNRLCDRWLEASTTVQLNVTGRQESVYIFQAWQIPSVGQELHFKDLQGKRTCGIIGHIAWQHRNLHVQRGRRQDRVYLLHAFDRRS